MHLKDRTQFNVEVNKENSRHAQLAPLITFSVAAFSQSQCRAGLLPQEHLASLAQRHSFWLRPQQVEEMLSACDAILIEALEYPTLLNEKI